MSGAAASEELPADYEIPIVDGSTLTYDLAYARFFAPNLPFIATGLTDRWPASRDWVKAGLGQPDWDFLETQYGRAQVGVIDCNEEEEETCPKEMRFEEVVRQWRSGAGQGLYIKDWHLRRFLRQKACNTSSQHTQASPASFPQERSQGEAEGDEFYTVPRIFSDDWMNSYYTARKEDDFAFVYFGTRSTSTPLHRDVCEPLSLALFPCIWRNSADSSSFFLPERVADTSYSWSANILGEKRWHFIPPFSAPFCRRDPSSRTSTLLSDPTSVNPALFPSFSRARVISVTQPAGGIIFVPSGWYHSVENTSEFVISINHNWANSVNLPSLYKSMCEEVEDTQEAVADVRELLERRLMGKQDEADSEWTQVVQDIVRRNAGWA